MRITELERSRMSALQAAFDLMYPARFVRQIILAKKETEIDQAMVSARQSNEWESDATVKAKLKQEGVKIPYIRTSIGQNFID